MSAAFDLSPLYRSMIGVDRMADLFEAALSSNADASYPPFDVEKTGQDSYRVTLAAAGFSSAGWSGFLELASKPAAMTVTRTSSP